MSTPANDTPRVVIPEFVKKQPDYVPPAGYRVVDEVICKGCGGKVFGCGPYCTRCSPRFSEMNYWGGDSRR